VYCDFCFVISLKKCVLLAVNENQEQWNIQNSREDIGKGVTLLRDTLCTLDIIERCSSQHTCL